MALFPSPRHALLVGRMEVIRQWRQTSSRGLAHRVTLWVFAGIFLLVASVALGFGGHAAGTAIREGSLSDPVEGGQFVVAGIVVFVAFVVAFRAITDSGRLEQADGMLTTRPHRDLVGGILVSEAGLVLLMVGLPAVSGAVAFAVGAGSPVSALLVLVAVAAAATVALSVGFALGMGLRNLLDRSAVVARHRITLGVLLFLVYMGLVVTETLDEAVGPVVAAFRRTPVAWFADLALLAVADGASAPKAAVALGGGAVVVLLAVAASVRFAGLLWFADPVDAAVEEATSDLGTRLAASPVGEMVGRPVGQVVVKSWLRARRAPIQLIFVAYPMFLLVVPVSEAIQTGRVPAVLPVTVALYAAWATGAAFTLNPLGDEGVVLPATLTSGVTGRQFVGGQMLAGAAVGAPAAALATVATGLAGPQSVATAVGLGLLSAALAVAATGIAAGVGVTFPRYESVRITRNTRAVVPSMLGFGVYSLVLVLAAIPGLLSQVPLVVSALASATGVPGAVVAAVGAVVALALAGSAGVVGTRHAVRRFDVFEM